MHRSLKNYSLPRVMPIGTLSERTGVKVETIRYYEQAGLLPEPERSEGNQRRYGKAHLERLNFIKHGRDLGFSVEAIRALLTLSDRPTMPCDEAVPRQHWWDRIGSIVKGGFLAHRS